MLSWILLSAASAAVPADPNQPFDLSRLDDPRPWQEQAQALLKGPDACIEVQGTVRAQVSVYTPGGLWSAGGQYNALAQGTFTGRLDHGVWTRLDTTWTEAPDQSIVFIELDRFRPMVGRIPERVDPDAAARAFEADIHGRYTKDEIIGMGGPAEDSPGSMAVTHKDGRVGIHLDGGGEEALGLVYDVLAEIDPDGTALYVMWEEDQHRVRLTESVPISKDDSFTIDTVFPGGDDPTRLDVVFPKRLKVDDNGVDVIIRDGQMHLRSQSTPLGVVPGVEGASAVLRMYGFTVGFDQRVAYERVRACPESGS